MTAADLTAGRLPWDAADPYPFYTSRRREGDVVWNDTAQAWLVLGYQAARQVLGGPGWSSDPLANPIARASMNVISQDFVGTTMLFADGANHQRLRESVRDVFTRSAVTDLTAGIEAIASAVVDRLPSGVPFDFMADVALPLPIAVIGEWLNLDTATADLLRELSPVIVRTLGTLAAPDEMSAAAGAFAALTASFLPMAADRRAHPGDDLLSFIAADPHLGLDEVVTTAILIAVAGHETTANLLGTSLIRLLTAGPDGTCLADHIEPTNPMLVTELLRLDGPVQSTVRTATERQLVGNVEIAAGQGVVVVVAAANRDPAVFDEPDRFRLDRTGPAPLSFGYGAHYCLGAALARLETTIGLQHVLARRPKLCGDPIWRETPAIRGPQTLPCTFTADLV